MPMSFVFGHVALRSGVVLFDRMWYSRANALFFPLQCAIHAVVLLLLSVFAQSTFAQNVTTFAGSGAAGFVNGTGTGAQFSNPRGVILDAAGNLYVTEQSNHCVRKITPGGVVTTFAGTGTAGFVDGAAATAQFNFPFGITTDVAGNLYVGDRNNSRIRKITPAGVVSTFAGSGTQGFADGAVATAQFNNPDCVILDASGDAYVADQQGYRIRKITGGTTVSTLAGTGGFGFADGAGATAQFRDPHGVALDAAGDLYVADANNHRIRKITPAGVVSTFAGSGVAGFADGTGGAAQFNQPVGVAFDALGNLFVADGLNHRIRKITPGGVVTTFAGNGAAGFADGAAGTAQFNAPCSIAFDAAGNVYVADQANHRIRKITISSASYSGTAFIEAGANDGSITQTRDVTLTNDTWIPAGVFTAGTDFTATGVPTGLIIAINRISATVARISFTGTAAAHANANDVTVTLNFTNAAVASGNAAAITGLNLGAGALLLDFNDPASAMYSSTTFPEAVANDGSITQTQDVTLTGDIWVPAGAFTGAGTHFTVTGVPVGLTLAINRISATVARISFIGTAAAHTAANNAIITLTFANAALTSGNAAAVSGLNSGTLSVLFDNPTPLPPPTPPPPIAPTITDVTFTGLVGLPFNAALSASGNPTPSLSIRAGALPSGISLGSTGLSGIPVEQGTFTFTLQASNSAGTSTANVTITIGPPVPLITGISPSTGTFGTAVTISGYNLAGATAVSIGGMAAESFSMIGGSLVAIVNMGGTGAANVSTPLGNASGGFFTFEQPPPPSLIATYPSPIFTGDSKAPLLLVGSNIPSYAGFSLMQLSSSGATVGFSVPLQMVSVSATGASLLIPPYALLAGAHRLTVRVGAASVSTTLAIILTTPPAIRSLSVSSTTANGAAFTTILNGTGFFRYGYGRIFVNGDESLYSSILDATTAQVHIPTLLNVRNGTVKIRLQNLDGQSTEATVRVIGRNAPLITSITPHWVNSTLQFVVHGVAFSSRITAVLGRRPVTVLPGGTDTEFTVAVPSDYTAPTFGTALLMVENPDGQRYGFLISAAQFVPPSDGTFATQKSNDALANATVSRVQSSTSNHDLYEELRLTPNPANDILTLETPAFTGVGHLQIVNMRGEEIVSGKITSEIAHDIRQTLDVRALPSGVYVVRFTAGGIQAVQQVRIAR